MSIPAGGRGHGPNVKRGPVLVAHRGAPREARENTLAAFERALARGAEAIELDVHLTADGIPAVHHDAAFTAGAGPLAGRAIASVTADELTQQDAVLAADVPLLADVAALVAGRATLHVEIKGGPTPQVVDAVHAAMASTTARTRAPTTAYALHAFDHRVALRSATVRADVPVGILSESYLIDTVGALRAARARDLWQHWSQIDAALVGAVHDAGGRVIAWTVNDADVAVRLAALGVDALCTDDVPAIRAALARGLDPTSTPGRGPP